MSIEHAEAWQWVDLGDPCPICVLTEPHLHSVNANDGTYGVMIKVVEED